MLFFLFTQGEKHSGTTTARCATLKWVLCEQRGVTCNGSFLMLFYIILTIAVYLILCSQTFSALLQQGGICFYLFAGSQFRGLQPSKCTFEGRLRYEDALTTGSGRTLQMSPSNVHYFWPIKCYICCTPTIYKAGPSHYVTWNMDVDHFF